MVLSVLLFPGTIVVQVSQTN